MFANAAPKSLALFRGWMPAMRYPTLLFPALKCFPTFLYFTPPTLLYRAPPSLGGWMPSPGNRRLWRAPTIEQSGGRLRPNWGINRANGPFNIEQQFLHIMPWQAMEKCSRSLEIFVQMRSQTNQVDLLLALQLRPTKLLWLGNLPGNVILK